MSSRQIKCDQYWPNRGTETYGMVQVTLLDTMELATFCVRTFSLHKVNPFSVLRLHPPSDLRNTHTRVRSYLLNAPLPSLGSSSPQLSAVVMRTWTSGGEEICLSPVMSSNWDSLPVSGAEIRSPLRAKRFLIA